MADRSLGADVLRTSECGIAASKRPPSRSLLDGLASDEPWGDAVEAFRTRHPRRRERIAAYEQLLEAGDHHRIGDGVLAGSYRPEPPEEAWLNKVDGRKKRVFQYGPPDELLFRVVNRLLQPAAASAASRWCRSFLPGGGARAAFRDLLGTDVPDEWGALRLDVRDYFNSIDVDDLLWRLPEPLADDVPVRSLLGVALGDPRVRRRGTVVEGGRKGVMAGTPLSPLLATLYLRDVDEEIAGRGTAYARYSDDIAVLAEPADLAGADRLLRRRLAERALQVNEAKSAVTAPGEPWDFLGFRYDRGTITLAPVTVRKFRTRTTRLARRVLRWRERTRCGPDEALGAYFSRLNRRIYGVRSERSDFSWATWFLPMLDRPDVLCRLDEHVQREGRYAATGRRTGRARSAVPYTALVEGGHLPLVPALWAMRDGVVAYESLVLRRARLG